MEQEIFHLENRLAEENEKLAEELQGCCVSLESSNEAEQLLEEQWQLHKDLQAKLMEAVERGDAVVL